MKQAIKTLEQLEDVLDDQIPPKQKDDLLYFVRDTIDAVVYHLKKKENNVSAPSPFDLDEAEAKTKGVLSQIDALTDAMLKLKRRFDKVVAKEHAPELNDLVQSMCKLSAHTIELVRNMPR